MTSQSFPLMTRAAVVVLVASLGAGANLSGIAPVAVVRDANSLGLPTSDDAQAAQVLLSANVARSYFVIMRLDEQ